VLRICQKIRKPVHLKQVRFLALPDLDELAGSGDGDLFKVQKTFNTVVRHVSPPNKKNKKRSASYSTTHPRGQLD
jgi:hypothetical protein